MLKLITGIDYNLIDDQIISNLVNTLENKTILFDETIYNDFFKSFKNLNNLILFSNNESKNQNIKIISNYLDIIKFSNNSDIYVIATKKTVKLLEVYFDEIILFKIKQDSNSDINLNYFYLVNTQEFNNYQIEYYNAYKNKILFGTKVINQIKKDCLHLKNELIAKYKKTPHLAIIQVGNQFASNIYISNKIKLLNELGLEHTLIKLDENVSQKEIINQINKFNKNKNINGILVQLPLPINLDINLIMNSIDSKKDVDCFNNINVAKLYTSLNQDDLLLPCTAYGVLELLKYYQIELESKNVVIVGRSNLVSKPLIPLLLSQNATVSICHSKTKNLKEITQKADIVISAIGKPKFFTKEYFNKDSIIIDIGINKDENNKVVGDVDFNNIINYVNKITPVPNGIGVMTLISLVQNLFTCFKIQHNKK